MSNDVTSPTDALAQQLEALKERLDSVEEDVRDDDALRGVLARINVLEDRPVAASGAPAPSGVPAGPDADAIVARAVEESQRQLHAQLADPDSPIVAQLSEHMRTALRAEIEESARRVAREVASATSVEERVRDIAGEMIQALRDELAIAAQAGRDQAPPAFQEVAPQAAVEQTVRDIAGEMIQAAREELAAAARASDGAAPGEATPKASGDAPPRAAADELPLMVARAVDEAHRRTLAALDSEGSELVTRIAEHLQGVFATGMEDTVRRLTLDVLKDGVPGEQVQVSRRGKTQVYDKKFLQLAREVRELKTAVEEAQSGAGAASGAGASALDLMASAEFKQMFDAKVSQVLAYMKSDVIPKAVKKAVEGN